MSFDFRFNPPEVTRYHSNQVPLPENGYRGSNSARYRSAELDASLDRFETMLTGRDYLMGEFSAADCAAFPFVKFARGRDPEDDELFHRILEERQPLGSTHPRLGAWIERVDARPRA